MLKFKNIFITLFLLTTTANTLLAQTEKQKALEEKRQRLAKELKQINALLYSNKKEEKSLITLIENLNVKVNVRERLIAVTNQQANLLTREISNNQKQIANLQAQLKAHKKEYAAMILKSYKTRNKESKVLFLLSSEDFKQAYKRLQYIKQYTNYQKEQANLIKEKTTQLQALNQRLTSSKKEKERLISQNKNEKQKIEAELQQRESLIATLKENNTKYTAQIQQKRQEIKNIDAEIDRLINLAIAAANKKQGTKTTKATTNKFLLTPEGKKLADNFEGNKGRLGWPVDRGVVKIKFGNQPSLIDQSITQNYKGIYIATENNAKVKAIFNGEVSAIQKIKYGNPVVMIRHGNYLSVYMNINNITVKKGDKVTTGQVIGEVFNSNLTEQPLLGLRVHRDTTPLDPEAWLARK